MPHGHWQTTTFTGALRLHGMTAPMVLDGPMNRAAFEAYIESGSPWENGYVESFNVCTAVTNQANGASAWC